ncbi:MAG: chemotaxis protein CheX [Myxococcota bacterium]
MDFEDEDLADIAMTVWEVLESGLEPTGPIPEGELRSGSVSIEGDWTGTVVVEAELESLRALARCMFEEAEVDESQLEDALAEITNMVGGNIKCLLEQESRLSLPSVPAEPEGHPMKVLNFRDPYGAVRLSVLSR